MPPRSGLWFALRLGVRVRALVAPVVPHRHPVVLGLLWFTVGLVLLLAASGCRRGPALETTPPSPSGVISGRIRGPERTVPVDGRIVELVNLTTMERTRVSTDEGGGFKFSVQPGDYRVEIRLRDGEALVREPGVIHVNRTDRDTDADFVLGTGRASRPRSPAYRVDDGLGSPVA